MLNLDLNLKLQNFERHWKLLSWAVLTVAGTLWLCPGVCPGWEHTACWVDPCWVAGGAGGQWRKEGPSKF